MTPAKRPAKGATNRAATAAASRGAEQVARSKAAPPGIRTLAVDVGGSGVKASVLDAQGNMMHERVRIETPADPTAQELVDIIMEIAKQLPEFDRVSVGFPGVVTNGVILTAPNLGTERFKGFDLAGVLKSALKVPVAVMNDADMQGYAAVKGKGVEMVITLGTGFGSSIFLDGRLGPHMEFAHHPFRKGETYEQRLGDEARRKAGNKRWSKRVLKAIDELRDLTNFDHLYIGGGNAQKLTVELPENVSVVDNTAGILGGIRLWHDGTGSA